MAVHGGYTEHLVGKVSSLARRVSRATRRLLRHRLRYGVSASSSSSSSRRRTRPVFDAAAGSSSFADPRQRQRQHPDGAVVDGNGKRDDKDDGNANDDDDKDDGIWRRAILMGERCQPLDFVGAIHYDSFGRRLARPPSAPRSASSLSCRSSDSLATYLETTDV